MTTASPTPVVATAPDMAHTADTTPSAPSVQAPPAQTATTTSARPTLRAQIADNPLLSFLGGVIVVLLAAAIAGPNMRISDTNARLDRLEATMEARFAAQDTTIAELNAKIDQKFGELGAKIDRLDAKFDEMNLKLTALIAALRMTGIVKATLEEASTARMAPTPTAQTKAPRAGAKTVVTGPDRA